MAALLQQHSLSRRPPSCISVGRPRATPTLVPSPPPPPPPRRAAVVARAKGSRRPQPPQKPRQRKSKAERSRPSAEDVAAFIEEDLLSDDDYYDDGEQPEELAEEGLEARRAAAYRRTRSGRAVPLPLTAPPPSDFDKAALAAADRGDPSALLEAERGQTYRVFADEEQDRAWQEKQRRIALRERRERIAAAAAEAAAAQGGGDAAAAAALAKAAGLPPQLDPASSAAALLRVGEQPRPARLWNPRTGFSRTPEELEAEEAAAAAALAALQGQGPSTLERVSAERRRIWEREERRRRKAAGGQAAWQAADEDEEGVQAATAAAAATGAAGAGGATGAGAAAAAAPSSGALPSVPRSQVLVSAAATGAAMTGLALLLRLFAASGAAAQLTGGDQAAVDALVSAWHPFPPPPTQQALGLAAGTAAAVTGARLALCALLPASFGAQTARSSAQVLSPLQWPADDALVALASGLPEELLFRGALIPATGHVDAAGVAAAAALFGALHLGGARGPAFAIWATGVGGAYGALMLACDGNVWAPALAHALANFASATAWRMGAVRAEAPADEGDVKET